MTTAPKSDSTVVRMTEASETTIMRASDAASPETPSEASLTPVHPIAALHSVPMLDEEPLSEGSAPARPVRPLPGRVEFHRHVAVGTELGYIAQAMRAGALSGDGSFTERCSALLAAELAPKGGRPAPKVLLTTSCTTSLEMAALLVKGDRDDPGEVIVPSFTFVSTANAFVVHGFTPVFVDVRACDGNMDPERIEEAITPRTRAIVPVHYGGVPCDMDAILAIARRHGIAVVEDAAQALYARWRGRAAGTLGDLGCFSFHDTKNIACGEGGALVINRREHRDRAQHLRDKGTNRSRYLRGHVDKYTWVDVGGSYLPSELQAAYLLAQLERADRIQARRAAVCARYREGLAELEREGYLRLSHPSPDAQGNDHIFWILLSGVEERALLTAHLAQRGIDARSHYVALHLSPMGRRWGRGPGSLPVTEWLGEGLLRLPVHPLVSRADADRVIDAITEFFRRPGHRAAKGGSLG